MKPIADPLLPELVFLVLVSLPCYVDAKPSCPVGPLLG